MLAHVGAGVRVADFLRCRECDFPKMDHGLTFSCFAKQLCPFLSVGCRGCTQRRWLHAEIFEVGPRDLGPQCHQLLLKSAIVPQGELATTSAELARASGEAEKLRGQLTASVAETQQLRSNLAKLSEETAVVERKLAAEVHTPSI